MIKNRNQLKTVSLSEEIIIKNLDHLGIVAGLIDEIGITEIINQKLGIDSREQITSGENELTPSGFSEIV